ncbi:hypothetical protein HanXRQr2_Chr13g0593401 [Helianthus annuus]|uniref:Uncharacterized protein n=1 Tax=Helianthus annuus TaxID=4232 RepID=A0A9K3EIM0_HELAN|nr:hypothetical protein HanXRQr2_Chr13g0593401 [Helianthus annuus]KAJ0849662.1 hypothetical protein HanPSC8_Chr13g0571431 [Helianthus annuus]
MILERPKSLQECFWSRIQHSRNAWVEITTASFINQGLSSCTLSVPKIW